MTKTTGGKFKIDFKNLGLSSSSKSGSGSNTPSRADSQQIDTADASKTDSNTNDTADNASKTNSQTNGTADENKASTKPIGSVKALNFNLGGSSKGLTFDTSKKPNTSTTEKGGRAFGSRMGTSKYDTFLNERISSGANSLNKKDKNKQSSSNQPKLTKKKENIFEVRYIPISGVHFDQIFINKENASDDDQSIGASFNQPAHISQTFDS